MAKRYFELFDDMGVLGRWHLGEVRGADGIEPMLDDGSSCSRKDLFAEVTHVGRVLEFCLTSFGVPVATETLGRAVVRAANDDVELVALRVAGQTGFGVLNARRIVRCVDESRSEFIKWTKHDHRADLVGEYRQVTRLRLDHAAIPEDANVFRVENWRVALIVSETVKDTMERVGCLGAKFIEVT